MSYKCNVNRVEIYGSLSLEEALEISDHDNLKYIQISKGVTEETLELVNDIILCKRKDIQFRVYGFRDKICNLEFLERLTNITDLSIGEMDFAENLEAIEKLHDLRRLRVNLNCLNNINFLQNVTDGIVDLMLGTEMNDNSLNLDIVTKFHNLQSLFVYKINDGFEALTNLNYLKKLTINASKITDFTFLKSGSVEEISLGMIKNNDGHTLHGNPKIKRLELWKLDKLVDLNILSKLPSLEYARIFQINSIVSLPDLRKCTNLKTLIFDELKNLTDISELAFAPSIENIEFYQAKSIDLLQIEDILQNPSIKKFKCKTGSVKKDKKINEIIEKYFK